MERLVRWRLGRELLDTRLTGGARKLQHQTARDSARQAVGFGSVAGLGPMGFSFSWAAGSVETKQDITFKNAIFLFNYFLFSLFPFSFLLLLLMSKCNILYIN